MDGMDILDTKEGLPTKSSLGNYVFNHIREAILSGKYK